MWYNNSGWGHTSNRGMLPQLLPDGKEQGATDTDVWLHVPLLYAHPPHLGFPFVAMSMTPAYPYGSIP